LAAIAKVLQAELVAQIDGRRANVDSGLDDRELQLTRALRIVARDDLGRRPRLFYCALIPYLFCASLERRPGAFEDVARFFPSRRIVD